MFSRDVLCGLTVYYSAYALMWCVVCGVLCGVVFEVFGKDDNFFFLRVVARLMKPFKIFPFSPYMLSPSVLTTLHRC